MGDVDGGETSVCGGREYMQNLCTFRHRAKTGLKIKAAERGEERRRRERKGGSQE